MTFAHPAALWLLAAAPLPVLLHLLGRVRPRVIEFPGTFLLREIQTRHRALRLRHWLLLMLRVLALAATALAVAGPRTSRALPLLTRPGQTVLLVDASASMTVGAGRAWKKAVETLAILRRRAGGALDVRSLPGEPPGQAAGKKEAGTLQPTLGQGAIVDAALEAARVQNVVVLTDMEASSVLPRAWPPGRGSGAIHIVDCGPPESAPVVDAWLRPASPPADTPVELRVARTGSGAVPRGPGIEVIDTRRVAGSVSSVAVRFARPAQHNIVLGTHPPVQLAAAVRSALSVRVVAGPARKYISAALDPMGTGRPLRPCETTAPVTIACTDAPVPRGLANSSIIVFLAPPVPAMWLEAIRTAGWPRLVVGTKSKPAATTSEGAAILIAPDCPPPIADVLHDFQQALWAAGVRQRTSVHAGDWAVAARFSDGTPAILWRERPRPAAVFAFAPTPQGAALVGTGAFAALLHALVIAMTPAEVTVAPSSGGIHGQLEAPPPAELAGRRADDQTVARAVGSNVAIVPARDAARAIDLFSDLVPAIALFLLVATMAEWLLSSAVSGGGTKTDRPAD